MRKERAQSSLEYLMIMGFAILIIVIVMSTLYGLDPLSVTVKKKCAGFAQFAYVDHYIKANTTTNALGVKVTIMTSAPEGVTVTALTLISENGTKLVDNKEPESAVQIMPGESKLANVDIDEVLSQPQGQRYNNIKIGVHYTGLKTGIAHTDYANCQGQYE